MTKRTLYSVQRMSPEGEWRTLLDFQWIPQGEATGALRMADAHYGTPQYRVIEDDPRDGTGDVVEEGGRRPSPGQGMDWQARCVIELDGYEVANLRAAIEAMGYPATREPPAPRSPLFALHNGDWVGQVYNKLPEVTEGNHVPNDTPEELAEKANSFV